MPAKKIVIAFFCILFSVVSHAEYKSADLNKLFTDKSQRAQIDAKRSGIVAPGLKKTNRVKVSGYVTRSNGKSVVWLNNTNTLSSSKIANVKVHQSTVGKNKKVEVSIEGETKRLKAGESWNKTTGKIVDHH